MSSPFRLGFMLRIPSVDEHDDSNPAHLYRDALELAVAADQLGFDSLWVTQHHFGTVDSILPSPLVFLAAVAARTRSIRLGTTVITASLEHPIRLAEDAATLDVLSAGRLELGLGTTSSASERAAFEVSTGGQRERLHRVAIDLRNAFQGQPLVTDKPDTVLQPSSPTLAGRIWLATMTRAHATFAASQGFGLITNYRPSELDDENRGYVEEYCRTIRQQSGSPRVGLSRGVYPTADRETARRVLMPHALAFAERGKRLGWLPDTFTAGDFFEREDIHVGEVGHVVERLQRDPGLPYATELLTGMLNARLSPRQLMPAMERIATEVAPALGWRPRNASEAA